MRYVLPFCFLIWPYHVIQSCRILCTYQSLSISSYLENMVSNIYKTVQPCWTRSFCNLRGILGVRRFTYSKSISFRSIRISGSLGTIFSRKLPVLYMLTTFLQIPSGGTYIWPRGLLHTQRYLRLWRCWVPKEKQTSSVSRYFHVCSRSMYSCPACFTFKRFLLKNSCRR